MIGVIVNLENKIQMDKEINTKKFNNVMEKIVSELKSLGNTIIVPESTKILIRVSTFEKFRKSRVSELIGLLKDYRDKYKE
ncbi:hypothetical protein DRN69_05185 [Candidatus Pacearchaeota archaeon]|nr:MAG: hypothetical protein DRN69_05185 [Candidatus Pacearchaeota archaeon]